jgi:ankyrin repeat protein
MHLASFFGQASTLELLIGNRARLETHSQNQLNATPLQSAVAAHQVKSAAVLLGHHANPNCRGELGYTPLLRPQKIFAFSPAAHKGLIVSF